MQGIAGDVIFIGIGEGIMIDDTDVAAFTYKLKWLIHMLHLIVVGMGGAVGRQQAIDTEGIEVGLVAKVTSVCPISVLFKSLVHPIPNGGSDNATVVVDDVPILL